MSQKTKVVNQIKCFFEGQVHCYFALGGPDDQHHLVCHGQPSYDDGNCFQIDARCLPDQSPTKPVEFAEW